MDSGPDSDSENTIPIYCGNDLLGYAVPVSKKFRIPATGTPFPCLYEMELNDSSKTKLFNSAPVIQIENSQIKIHNDKKYKNDNAVFKTIERIPHFTVRLTADGASRDWEFRCNKKSDYTLQEVLETINDDCEDEDLFELGYGGAIVSVAGFPVQPTKDSKAFVLFAWEGEPVTDLKDLKPHKNGILDVILVSRAFLETRQSDTLPALMPFKETLEKWAKDGLFDGENLAWNLMDEEERLAEIKRLAVADHEKMKHELSRPRKAGERIVLRADGVEYAFRWCPPGEFTMGRHDGFGWEKPAHKVKLTRGFWLLETEVTQAMWQSVMGQSLRQQRDKEDKSLPLRGEGPNYPMYYVSWEESQLFCKKLSQKLGHQIQFPTEAQWEYACRAGTTGDSAGNLDSMAWHRDNSGRTTHAVGQKNPNPWGLYDMHGNVWEMCSDYYDASYYKKSQASDPENTTPSSLRVQRGGSWDYIGGYCLSTSRSWNVPGFGSQSVGLRPVLVPGSEE